MDHESLVKYILAPMITAIVAIVGWSLITVVDLKEDVASVKTEVKHISKAVDRLETKLAIVDDSHENLAKN